MKKVFISYAYLGHYSRVFAGYLHKSLKLLELEPVGIFDELFPGSDWQKSVTEQINQCSIFVCIFELNNPKIMFELGYALAKNKKIIVVGGMNDLPVDLRNMTYLPLDVHPSEVISQIEKHLAEELPIPTYAFDATQPKQTIDLLLDRPELLDSIEPRKLEELVMRWFDKRGYEVESCFALQDYGYDFAIQPFRGGRAVVEVKKFKSTSQVPLEVIRQLVGSMTMERIPNGIIVSTAPFTKSARYFVKEMEHTVFLWTLEDLARMAKMSNRSIERHPDGVSHVRL